jgi:hypothetical protein
MLGKTFIFQLQLIECSSETQIETGVQFSTVPHTNQFLCLEKCQMASGHAEKSV